MAMVEEPSPESANGEQSAATDGAVAPPPTPVPPPRTCGQCDDGCSGAKCGRCSKWAAIIVGVLGVILLLVAAFVAAYYPADPIDPGTLERYTKAVPSMNFDEVRALATEHIRSLNNKITALAGVGLICIGFALFCLNHKANDLLIRIGRRVSKGISIPGLILITLVIVFAIIAIPIGYRPTSQFLLDLAKVGFGAFLAAFIRGQPADPPNRGAPRD
jgi:hypothetical protein